MPAAPPAVTSVGLQHPRELCDHQACLDLHGESLSEGLRHSGVSPSLDGRPGHTAPALMLVLRLLLLLGRRQAVAALVAAGRPGRLLLLLLLAAAREAELRGRPLQSAVVDHEVVLHTPTYRLLGHMKL